MSFLEDTRGPVSVLLRLAFRLRYRQHFSADSFLAGTASWQRQLDQVSRQQFSHLNVLKSFPVNLREHCLFSLFFDRCFIAALFQSLEWSLNVPSCKLQVRPFSSYGSRTRRFRGTRVVEWSGVLFHSEQLFVVWGL